jgi:hypothetical protein
MYGRNLLALELTKFDWTYLEIIEDVNVKAAYFNSSIMLLLDKYLPVYVVSRHTADKPWVIDNFRRLIRCRQYA